MKKMNIGLAYKKDGRISQARLTLSEDIVDFLKINEEEKKVKIIYSSEDRIIKICKIGKDEIVDNIERKLGEKLIFFQTSKDIAIEKTKKLGKYYYTKKIFIPLPIINALEINKEDREIFIVKSGNEIHLTKEKNMSKGMMITIKVNKGGVGKTFLSIQLGHGLALNNKKVLLLTSDSQNNILDFSFKNNKIPEFEDGLKAFVKGEKGDLIKLRKNLDFIPLENNKFSSQFLKDLPKFLEKIKEEYDFVIVDSIPTMKLDSTFVACSEKVIIPVFCDRVTVSGALNVIDEAGIDKILAVVINLYRNTANQNLWKEKLKNAIEGTDIIFPQPIRELSQVETLLEKGKTIWESESKIIQEVQESIIPILEKLLQEGE